MIGSVLVTGSQKGLGLGIVKYLVDKADLVIATYLDDRKELDKVAEQNKNVQILRLDVSDVSSFEPFALQVEELVRGDGLNLLINNAGVLKLSRNIDEIDERDLYKNIAVNAAAPLFLTKALLPLLQRAAEVYNDKPVGIRRAAVLNISTRMSSIDENSSGAAYEYRASKAAQNAITKSMSIDFKPFNILVAAFHPGWVRTDMGGGDALIDVETSVSKLYAVWNSLAADHNGKLLANDGNPIPW